MLTRIAAAIVAGCALIGSAHAQEEPPVGTPKGRAYVNCILAHAIDLEPGANEDEGVLTLMQKCGPEMGAFGNECEADPTKGDCGPNIIAITHLAVRFAHTPPSQR
jgi:hypothetical protein